MLAFHSDTMHYLRMSVMVLKFVIPHHIQWRSGWIHKLLSPQLYSMLLKFCGHPTVCGLLFLVLSATYLG